MRASVVCVCVVCEGLPRSLPKKKTALPHTEYFNDVRRIRAFLLLQELDHSDNEPLAFPAPYSCLFEGMQGSASVAGDFTDGPEREEDDQPTE